MIAVRLSIVFVITLTVQSPDARPPASSFRTETRLVVLHATVKNGRGELVTNLERNAFAVYENGQRQPLTLFRRDDVPVSLGLLIDNSGSMRLIRSRVEAAALACARASNPQDEMFVLNFADKPHIDVPLTNAIGVLEAGVARVDSIGGTALRDAVDLAETYLKAQATRDRRVLLVITDGNDNASMVTPERVQKLAEQSETQIYAIGLFRDGTSSTAKHGHHELDQLTERTGGLAYYPDTIDQIEAVAVEIARQIRNQYTIAYTPLNQALDGSYRTIRVEARGPDRLVVRTRAGYRATAINAPAPSRPQ
jgi:Ca-activated chloride channel homolog